MKPAVDELRLILRAAYLRSQGKMQTEIADMLKISESMVSRLLSQSHDFVQLSYKIPPDSELENKLIYAFGLNDAIVVEAGGPEMETHVIGRAAAEYFDGHVNDGDGVALSCGCTLLAMLEALPGRPKHRINISQLSIECDPEYIHHAPATLAALLRRKYHEQSSVYGIQLPPPGMVQSDKSYREELSKCKILKKLHRDAKNANFLFIGVGSPIESGEIRSRLLKTIGAKDARALAKFIEEFNVVCEINNRLIDANGQDRTDEIPAVADRVVSILTTNELRQIVIKAAKKGGKGSQKVVAIATGASKADAIGVTLKHKLANVLITSRETAELVLERWGSDSAS